MESSDENKEDDYMTVILGIVLLALGISLILSGGNNSK